MTTAVANRPFQRLRHRRSVREAIRPAEELARGSQALFTSHLEFPGAQGERITMPRFLFTGPGSAGASFLRVGIFGGLHGDEEAGVHGAIAFLERLVADPGIAAGYPGVLSAPPSQHPRPLEIVFETPHHAPMDRQVEAHGLALETILGNFRAVLSEAQNI